MKLPPMNALRACEVAARRMSFKAAAEELCVTQGAVSRHVQKLEDSLGIRLFERHHREVRLTPEGAAYLSVVHRALNEIATATEALSSKRNSRTLRIKSPPTFAILWLVQRLTRFNAAFPDLSIQVTTSHDPVNFDVDDVDAAICYGDVGNGRMIRHRLFNEAIVPAMSAAMAAKMPSDKDPAWLRGQVLLHSSHRLQDWPQWFELAGMSRRDVPEGLIFENSGLTFQGALEGLGVAMVQLAFALDDMRSGRLVVPYDIQLTNDAGYDFMVPADRVHTPRIRDFHDWIVEEARATRTLGKDYPL